MATQLTDTDKIEWSKFLTDFDSAWKSFNDNYQALIKLAPYIYQKHPELKAEYDRLLNDGSANYNKLVSLKETRDTVKNWISGAYETAKEWFGLSGLGIVPIWVAISVGSAAALIYAVSQWISSAYDFSRRTNELQRLEAQGYTSDQAATIIQKTYGTPGGGIFSDLAKIAPWAIAGIFLLFFAPPLVKRLRRGSPGD